MQTYSKYAPTGFDSTGAFLPNRQDWFVIPVGRNRDSGPATESNFKVALDMLGGESDDVEVCNFGHWACGWFEIIIVRPETNAEKVGSNIDARLEDYPFLDEEDVSNREYDEFLRAWTSYGAHDFRKAMSKSFAMTEEDKRTLDALDDDKLREFYIDRASESYTPESGGVYIGSARMVERMSDNDYRDLITLASGKSLKENLISLN